MLDLVIVEIIRSPDLRHTKETHWRHLSYLDVTSNTVDLGFKFFNESIRTANLRGFMSTLNS